MNLKMLTASLVFLAAALPPQAHAAKVCRPAVSISDSGPTDSAAIALAKTRWTISVTQKHSAQWANWGNASSRSTSCKTVTSNVGLNLRKCLLSAKPCRYQ